MKAAMIHISSGRLMLLTPTWLVLSLGGFAYWEWQDRTPGPSSHAPQSALVDSASIRPDNRGLKIMLFLHPHCPCARASLRKLANCVAELEADAELFVIFVRPPGAKENWEKGASWQLAMMIPGARVQTDVDGQLARSAGVHTSGHVIVEDSMHSIRFFGGITKGRGLEEDCSALRAFHSQISGEFNSMISSPVFGCPLFDSNSIEAGGD